MVTLAKLATEFLERQGLAARVNALKFYIIKTLANQSYI